MLKRIVAESTDIRAFEPMRGKRSRRFRRWVRSNSADGRSSYARFCARHHKNLVARTLQEQGRLLSSNGDNTEFIKHLFQLRLDLAYHLGNHPDGEKAVLIALRQSIPLSDNSYSHEMTELIALAQQWLDLDRELRKYEGAADTDRLFHLVSIQLWWKWLSSLERLCFYKTFNISELNELARLPAYAALQQASEIFSDIEEREVLLPSLTPLDITSARPNAPNYSN